MKHDPIFVKSEIQPLKRVLVHRPGDELLHLTPDTLEELLFDDIPYMQNAQSEHDAFTDLLRSEGVEVVYLEDLMTETLDANPGLRDRFLNEWLDDAEVFSPSHRARILDYLSTIQDTKVLVNKTIAGIPNHEMGTGERKKLVDFVERPSHFAVNPMPNLYFARDPFASVGTNVLINHMYSKTRNRETIYADYIFHHHPAYAGKVRDLYGRHRHFHMEGGDVLNISEDTLLIGVSQRTEADAVELLAKELFFSEQEIPIRQIYAATIPMVRNYMHLDTVLTQIDVNAFTYYPNIRGTLGFFRLTPGKQGRINIDAVDGELEEVLEKMVGVDEIKLYPCGGGDSIAAEREQWTDGANTLTLKPRTIVVYQRNFRTNEMLDRAGFRVLTIDADNLSVGRGGPRCMSMPLEREYHL